MSGTTCEYRGITVNILAVEAESLGFQLGSHSFLLLLSHAMNYCNVKQCKMIN